MTKFKLLTTTAIFAGALALSAPVHAETQGWYANMKTKVQNWFADDAKTETNANAEVEAYLDEVTVAVPPVSADDVAAIEPAAGDVNYAEIEGLHDNDTRTLELESDYSNSVTAFGDPAGAEEYANIQPAAGGDAEEITDESIVVAEETEVEAEADAEVHADVDAAVEATEETADDAVEATEEAAEDTAEAVEEATEEAAEDAAEATEEMADDAADAMEEKMDEMKEMGAEVEAEVNTEVKTY